MLQLAVLRKSAVNVVADCNTVQCMFRCTWGKWSCTCTNLRWRTHPSATKLCRVTFLEKLELCVILALGSIPASAAFVYLASSRHVGTFPSLFFVGLGFSWSECWLVCQQALCLLTCQDCRRKRLNKCALSVPHESAQAWSFLRWALQKDVLRVSGKKKFRFGLQCLQFCLCESPALPHVVTSLVNTFVCLIVRSAE